MEIAPLEPSLSPVELPGSRVPVVYHRNAIDRLADYVRTFGASRVLLVTDPGVRDAGHAQHAVRPLYHASLVVRVFDDVVPNPTSTTVARAARLAREIKPDLIVALGGGSAMDTAKGANFICTNGGTMADYHGRDKATRPMLPLIAIPTTAGTGSEAQSYALISDPDTHVKMACGDAKALPRLAILDPDLVATVPRQVAAAVGIDAIAHAVESSACTRRNDISRAFSRAAWRLLADAFEPALVGNRDAQADALLGAHFAGCAIESSMLGAAHAAANPLTALHDTTHGLAVGLMLPHVVRFNGLRRENPYADLSADPEALASRLDRLLIAARLPRRLRDLDVPEDELPRLAALAAKQWTAQFNPRPVGEDDLLALYRSAF